MTGTLIADLANVLEKHGYTIRDFNLEIDEEKMFWERRINLVAIYTK